jgi:hypothetical protein
VNEQDQDRYEAELRRAPPARVPEPLMARLLAAKRGPEPARTDFVQNLLRGRNIRSLAPARWPLWRWLAPALLAGVAGWLVAGAHLPPGNSAERKPAQPTFGMKADDVHVNEELVSSYDVVAKLPGGEPVRFRCRQWRDQWRVTDTNRGVEIVQNNPRVEVIPVRFETY